MNSNTLKFDRPKIVVSKCLEFDNCRYDGQLINNKYIRKLKEYVDFTTICPEVEIGLGTPRDPIHLVRKEDEFSLYQPSTDRDLGSLMNKFSNKFLSSLSSVDGFILKSRSPSCGISTAKQFPDKNNKSPMGHGPGLFTAKIIEKYPNHPKEEDKRLNDNFLREHFYASIFTISEYRNVKSFKELYDFQAKHKLLFMAYNQSRMKILGKIAANKMNSSFEEVKHEYFLNLLLLFKKRPRYISNINTHMHAYGFYKKYLKSKEKVFFLELLDDYRSNLIPLSTINSVMNSWNVRFENEYLIKQSYFNSFPEGLVVHKESRMK